MKMIKKWQQKKADKMRQLINEAHTKRTTNNLEFIGQKIEKYMNKGYSFDEADLLANGDITKQMIHDTKN